ncbi:MAG TPA: cell filamentation protein Fic [Fibrobacteres bacterium]|nr:cell filamentation protein Fic [Fibrobacterota bacterium]
MEPYISDDLPIKDLDYTRLIGFVGQANAELARYDGLLQGIVNPTILLSPLTTQEAVLSSKIEGTQATLDEVLEHEAGMKIEGEKEKDIQEIVNYRKSLMAAKDVVAERPISLGLLRQMHSILLDSVRGSKKSPGEFRKTQNYIGRPGATIEQASFVPPSPMQLMNFLEQWETYICGSDVDVLIQAAVTHAQFEILHPFNDGNGRIGRLLIPLFLFQKKCISSPMFYLSEYLEEHRDEYYSALRGVTQEKDWNTWVSFFLEAVATQARKNTMKVRKIMALYEDMKKRITEITRSQYAIKILDALFDYPVFSTSDFLRQTGIPKQTAMPLVQKIRDAHILKSLREASGTVPAILVFSDLLNIAEGKKVL